MTQNARIVLQDANYAIARHNDTLQSEGFRISWFAIVGLLRAIGDVLEKVDKNSSPGMKKAINEKWVELQASRPEPQIFWGFIEYERNRFLKNYEHGISRSITVPAVTKGYFLKVDCGNSQEGLYSPGSKLDSKISDGPYAGCSEKDIAWQAYDWWVAYLNEIDKLAAGYDSA